MGGWYIHERIGLIDKEFLGVVKKIAVFVHSLQGMLAPPTESILAPLQNILLPLTGPGQATGRERAAIGRRLGRRSVPIVGRFLGVKVQIDAAVVDLSQVDAVGRRADPQAAHVPALHRVGIVDERGRVLRLVRFPWVAVDGLGEQPRHPPGFEPDRLYVLRVRTVRRVHGDGSVVDVG